MYCKAACQDPDKLNPLASSLVELLTLDQEDMTATLSETELGKLNKSVKPWDQVFYQCSQKELSELVLPPIGQFTEFVSCL